MTICGIHVPFTRRRATCEATHMPECPACGNRMWRIDRDCGLLDCQSCGVVVQFIRSEFVRRGVRIVRYTIAELSEF